MPVGRLALLDRLFHLRDHGTTVAVEVRAGLVTFLTMSYILLVNPQILGAAGMPTEDVVLATALASAAACLIMGLWAGFPFALAPGMGLNAYFAYSVVLGMGVSWQVALAAVFVEGLLFLVLSLTGVRTALLAAIPRSIKLATMSGIGLFLALIGLRGAGVVTGSEATLTTLGELAAPATLLSLAGFALMAALLARRVPGAILVGIAAVTLAAWGSGLAALPETWWSLPRLPRETFLALDLKTLFTASMLPVIFAFLFVDLLDTAGTLVGVGHLAGLVDENGDLPGSDRAFAADAVGTSLGALLGTSTVTTYIESATGVEEGGRTGLTAVTVAVLFLLSLFAVPLVVAVPAIATAPALILVGALMMPGLLEIDWKKIEDAVPAFLTVTMMPFTSSIANGIALGILAHVVLRVLLGRWREVGWVLWLLAAALGAFYALA